MYIIKFSSTLSSDIESRLDSLMCDLLNETFSKKERDLLILDEDNGVMVAFISESDEFKLNRIVHRVNILDDSIITKYEEVTDKFLYDNDFSDYDTKSDLIQKFMKDNLSSDDVLDKISAIGISNLTEVDLSILQNV